MLDISRVISERKGVRIPLSPPERESPVILVIAGLSLCGAGLGDFEC